MDLETTVCLFCGVDDSEPLLRRERPRHVVCRRCGLVYQNPRPTVAEMGKHYADHYWEERGLNSDEELPARSEVSIERGQCVVDWTHGTVRPADLVVEVGCGPGEIVSYVRDQLGCQVLGIEPSHAQAESATRRFGLQTMCGSLEDLSIGDRKAKVVFLSHVAEHFHDPRTSLGLCRDLLADDGWLFVEVPNILGANPRKRLTNWLTLEHMFYFSPNTLTRLLQQIGFRVTRCEGDLAVRVLARKASLPATVSDHRPAVDGEYRRVKRAIWRHELKYWPRYVVKRIAGSVLPAKA